MGKSTSKNKAGKSTQRDSAARNSERMDKSDYYDQLAPL